MPSLHHIVPLIMVTYASGTAEGGELTQIDWAVLSSPRHFSPMEGKQLGIELESILN